VRVTALRAATRDRVAIELDGSPWRTLPASVAVGAGLAVGRELDRPTARELRRLLRRAEALDVAARALRHRDLPAVAVHQRLERAGVASAARAEALDVLDRAGVVDDGRFANTRARSLSERGFGDEAIRHDLERQGVPPELVGPAVGALSPEIERARDVVARRGPGPRTARYLASKGFAEDAVETAVDTSVADDT
jgi:SOS response regulatory protein OraA/RecX